MATESEDNMKAKEYKNIKDYIKKKKDNSKNGDVFTNCRDDSCKAPLYKNTSQSDTRYCMDCL